MPDELKVSKVTVDREKCISVASCVSIDPDTYELDAEGKAIVKQPMGADAQKILEGAKSCPVNAIVVTDDQGKQIWPLA